jgi:hypothetical protein
VSGDREHLADLVDAVERLAVVGHEHLRDLAARGRAHLDRSPEDPCSTVVERASSAAYAAGRAAGVDARPDRRQGAP